MLLLFHSMGVIIVAIDLICQNGWTMSDLEGHQITSPFLCIASLAILIFLVACSLVALRICHQLYVVNAGIEAHFTWIFRDINSSQKPIFIVGTILSVTAVSIIIAIFKDHPVAIWFWLKNAIVIFAAYLEFALLTTARLMLLIRGNIRRNTATLSKGGAVKSTVAENQEQTAVRIAAVSILGFIILLGMQLFQLTEDIFNRDSQLNYNYLAKPKYDGITLEIFHIGGSLVGIFFSAIFLSPERYLRRQAPSTSIVKSNSFKT